MATWADIQSWDHGYVIEAEDLIEQELREARELVSDIEHAAHDIRSQGKGPDQMRQRLSEIQALLDARINELSEYAMATAALHGYVSRVVAMRKSAWEVAAEIDCEISESGEVILGPDSGETMAIERVSTTSCAILSLRWLRLPLRRRQPWGRGTRPWPMVSTSCLRGDTLSPRA